MISQKGLAAMKSETLKYMSGDPLLVVNESYPNLGLVHGGVGGADFGNACRAGFQGTEPAAFQDSHDLVLKVRCCSGAAAEGDEYLDKADAGTLVVVGIP